MPLRKCDILVYRLYQGDATSQHTFELARILADLGIQPAIYSNYPLGDLPPDIRSIAQQSSFAAYRSRADLTILQYPLWFPLAERLRTSGGARVFWYHGVTPPEYWPIPEERDLLETSQVRTELANFAHLAVATSPFTAAELQAYSDFPPGRMRIVPLGVDIEAFAVRPSDVLLADLRKRWQLENKRVLLYVGRIAGNKRIDLLIDALGLLSPAHPDLHLLVVGDDGDGIATQALASELRRRAKSRGITDRTTFTGRVPDVAPYYHLADVYVQTSQHEGFGVPLIEAMAADVPVIASASGAMPWLLKADAGDAETAGLIVPPGDAEQLAECVTQVLTRPDLCRRLVDRGRQRAQEFNRQAFRTRAAVVLCEAIEMEAAGVTVPEAVMTRAGLYRQADVVPRAYTVTSRIPLLGKHVAKTRTASTFHLKEAYFDRVMERQVNFNRRLAEGIGRLDNQLPPGNSQPSRPTAKP